MQRIGLRRITTTTSATTTTLTHQRCLSHPSPLPIFRPVIIPPLNHFGANNTNVRRHFSRSTIPTASTVTSEKLKLTNDQPKKRLVLGIETSCDDTGVAIVNERGEVISERLITHYDIVKQYGGVYPDQVAKCHEVAIGELIEQVRRESLEKMAAAATKKLNDERIACGENGENDQIGESDGERPWIDAIAVTCGPGLNPCLKVGVQAAKRLSKQSLSATSTTTTTTDESSSIIPVIAINHLEAHLLSPRMFSSDIQFPYLTLLISGGHCLLVHTRELGSYEILVTTTDDSIGEAFDKVARLLDIDYGEEGFKSAGAALEHRASLYRDLSDDSKQQLAEIKFAVPLRNRRKKDAEYSFSGLKANVLRSVRILEMRNSHQMVEQDRQEENSDGSTSSSSSSSASSLSPGQIDPHKFNQYISQHKHTKGQLSHEQKIAIAYEFQNTAFTHLIEKTELAISKFDLSGKVRNLVVCGGVAANQALRSRLEQLCHNHGMTLSTPPIKYCTDNGVMVAWAGMERCQFSESLLNEPVDTIDLRGRWPLTTLSNQRNFVKEQK